MRLLPALVCSLLCTVFPTAAAEAPGESSLCGRSMYLQIFDQQFDTVLSIDTTGKTVVKIGNPTAAGIAILSRMGYQIAFLCQYRWELDKAITLPANSTRYKTAQLLVSNYLLETIDSCASILTPESPQQVTISFSPCGRSVYHGRSLVTDTAVFMDMSRMRPASGVFTSEELERVLFRRVFGAYLILKKPIDLTVLTREVEKEMDRLKLDFSYKTPQFTKTSRLR